MNTRIAIIGGGLSGLALADHLHRAGEDFQLFEARERFGGRIMTHDLDGSGFDLGPSWFWPGQHRMAALVHRLELKVLNQYSDGAQAYETETGEVMRDMGFASMHGSLRLGDGMAGLVEGLVSRLPTDRLHRGYELESLSRDGVLRFGNGSQCNADHLVLAVPPRVAAGLAYEPVLEPRIIEALQAVPTWMGGHAKFVAVYEKPFWRDASLSGDAMSRRGPLVEIHDASPEISGRHGALFGFLGVPAATRAGHDDEVVQAAVSQLGRIFGPKALNPVKTFYQDWAFEKYTSSQLDQAPLSHHPAYRMPDILRSVWQDRLHFASTELAPEMGGFLEGALASAEATADHLVKEMAA